MKMKNKAILLGAAAVIGGYLVFANGKKPSNSILDEAKTPVVKTAYTSEPPAPVDFEKAAGAAVPSVVHIKTTTKFKQVAGRPGMGDDQDPFGGMQGDLFRRFFGEGEGRAMPQPDQKASG